MLFVVNLPFNQIDFILKPAHSDSIPTKLRLHVELKTKCFICMCLYQVDGSTAAFGPTGMNINVCKLIFCVCIRRAVRLQRDV